MYLALLKNPQNSETELALLYNGVCVVCVSFCLSVYCMEYRWVVMGRAVQEYIDTKLNLRSF